MAKNYDAPIELRGMEKMINDFSYKNGYDTYRVFDDFLRYVIFGFSLDEKPLENWEYKKEENTFFGELLKEWVLVTSKKINISNWYDALGELYMCVISSNSTKSSLGQFFTPPIICDLMVSLSASSDKSVGKICGDVACGSGRTLLAFHVVNLGNYLCAEDINKTCCLMSCCNFIIHGCVGEVVWHDSLDPSTYYGGWKINEYLTHTGIPTIRNMEKEESLVWKNHNEQKPKNQITNIGMQLSLFGDDF